MDKVKRTKIKRKLGIIVTYYPYRPLGVVWSSNEVHMVDALAVRGDERRDSLR